MALARWQATIQDDAGNIIQGASVTVRRETSGSPLAVLYTDRDGTISAGNPVYTDVEGFVGFHVAGGAYRITAEADGFSREWRYVGIGTAQELDGELIVFADENDDLSGIRNFTLTGYIDFTEVSGGSPSEPDAPAADVGRVYTVDDGAGETMLVMKDSAGDIAPLSHFQQSGTGAVTMTQQAKLRAILHAIDFGFSSSASAAVNKTALDNAVTAAVARGGAFIELPSGTFDVNPLASISGNGIVFRGQGQYAGGTYLRTGSTTADFMTFTGQHSGVRDLCISGSNVKATAGFALVFSSSFQCVARDIRIEYMFRGIRVLNGSSFDGSRILFRYLLGDRGIILEGTAGNGLYGARVDKIDADNPYPQTYGTVKTWATSTAFSLNDIVRVNNIIWQCSTAGTSAGAGGGPSGVPGTNGGNAFTTTVTDGTVQWKFVCHATLIWFYVENFAYSTSIDNSSLINGWKGLFMGDTAASGSSFPVWLNSHGLEVDHSYDNCVHLERGEGAYLLDGWFGSSLSQRGMVIDTNFRGEVFVGSGTRIVGNWLDGVLLQAGPRQVVIDGNFIYLNSQNGSGNNHGINVGAGADDFTITNNVIGAGPTGSAQQGYGVFIGSGASDDIIVAHNDLRGNATGAFSDGSTSVRKVMWPNVDGSSPGLIGYPVGSGGTVTQATNKSTGVTLNKPTGTITMNNAALAANTTVSFTLTNSTISANDQIICEHISGGTLFNYSVRAVAAGGSATISVRNITAGSLSDAVVLKFTVIKAAVT